LRNTPKLLVLENPTQGLDVHAADAMHAKIRTAANDGTGVVIYSSDLDELATISDRVVVVRGATIVSTSPDRESVGALLLETAR
jgi:ribose transport system ATP-binding protein